MEEPEAYLASSIFVRVMTFLPSFSEIVPSAVTFVGPWQIVLWKALATGFASQKICSFLPSAPVTVITFWQESATCSSHLAQEASPLIVVGASACTDIPRAERAMMLRIAIFFMI